MKYIIIVLVGYSLGFAYGYLKGYCKGYDHAKESYIPLYEKLVNIYKTAYEELKGICPKKDNEPLKQ